ncbi:SPW repeat protein [Streptomyces beihaiensis]|uniref:SPW repeat protein n=1 Tax=Streptomyces beihaiensis TaxID=2984495 RepID=A0ABT3U167_9ACTN|nr:SPW repeat protein [Streptomyces beihaiensis]MCX3063068.1 SPW repeat protein [Streptomyces beihaiensis]
MADVSHQRADITSHPDVTEMRDRYDRVLGGRDVPLVDGPVFLTGLYCAISPWVVHFNSTQPALTTVNLIVGISVGLLGLGFTVMPARMYGLSWGMCVMGVWLVIAPWVVSSGGGPDKGIIISNAIIGGLTCLLGLLCLGVAMKSKRESHT